MSILVIHERQQWAVGHGFFHTASIKLEGGIYRYAYDCGGGSIDLVKHRIDSYTTKINFHEESLDFLVLSHFHMDHIKGVPYLLSKLNIKKLILPYLSLDHQLIALISLAAEGAEEDSADGAVRAVSRFSGLILSPEEWLAEQGKENVQVTLIQAGAVENEEGEEDGEEDGFVLPSGIVNASTNGRIKQQGVEVWNFRFYVEKNEDNFNRLLGLCMQKFGISSKEDLLDSLSNESWIRENYDDLKIIYHKNLIKNSKHINRTSLCMYSGPPSKIERGGFCVGNYCNCDCSYHCGCYCYDDRPRVGWMGTGDAVLKEELEFKKFKDHYVDYIKNIDTLCIPHHGSIENYCDGLGDIGNIAVITAREELGGKHPNPEVVRSLLKKGKYIRVVTKEDESSFCTKCYIYYCL